MKGIGYFLILRNFLGGFFERNLFGGIFWEKFFGSFILGGFFLEDFFWRIFLEEFFGRNYLVEINKELMFLSRFWGNARRRRKDKKFRYLEVRGKLIALKKKTLCEVTFELNKFDISTFSKVNIFEL